jgi:hypothetical protein
MSRECVVGVFGSIGDAQEAIEDLQRQGWSHQDVSLITRGNPEELGTFGAIRQGDSTEKTAVMGGAAGAALGFLAGSSLFIIPGLGPVLFAGAMASGITGGLVGGLVGAMSGWGIQDDHVQQYEAALNQGKAIVLLSGHPAALAEGRALLLASAAEKTIMHAQPADSKVDA